MFVIKNLTVTTLVFSLTYFVGITVSISEVNQTSAQAVNSSLQNQANKLYQQGIQQYRRGDYKQALSTYQEVLKIRCQIGDKVGEGQVLNEMGLVYNSLVQNQKALEVLQQALTIHRDLKDRTKEAETLDNIGSTYYGWSQNQKALEILQQALAIRREAKDKAGEGVTLSKLGLVYSALKQTPKALEVLKQALAIHNQVGDKFQAGNTLYRIGSVYRSVDDYTRALEWYNKALTVNKETGNRASLGRTLLEIARAYYFQDKYQSTIEFAQQALPLIQDAGISSIEANILTLLGLAHAQNDAKQTLKLYQQAIAIHQTSLAAYQQANDRHNQLDTLISILRLHELSISYLDNVGVIQEANKISKLVPPALKLVKELQRTADEKEVMLFQAKADIRTGIAYINLKELQKARSFTEKGLNVARQYEDLVVEAFALSNLTSAYHALGEDYKTIPLLQRQLEIAQQQKDTMSEAQALITLGAAYAMLGELQQGIDLSRQALAKTDTININTLPQPFHKLALKLKPNILGNLSLYHTITGEFDQALDFAQQRFNLVQNLSNLELQAEAMIGLASVYAERQELQKVIDWTQQAAKLTKQIQNPTLEAAALKQLSQAYAAQKNYQQAIQTAKIIFNQADTSKNSRLKIQALIVLSNIYLNQGNYQKALELLKQRLTIAKSQTLIFHYLALQGLGEFYQNLGDYQKSEEFYQQSLTLGKKYQNPLLEGVSLFNLAVVGFKQGEPRKTIQLAQQGLAISQKNKIISVEFMANEALSQGYGELNNDQKATSIARANLALARKVKNPHWQTNALVLLGNLHRKFGRKQDAVEAYKEGLGIVSNDWRVYAGLARAYTDLNQPNEAIKNYQQAIERIEDVRRNLKGLAPESQLAFLQATVDFERVKVVDIYRQYADLLLKQGRTLEAQRVLELLRYEEVKDYLRVGKGVDSAVNDRIVALGKELNDLENIPVSQRSVNQQQRIIALRKQQESIIKEFGEFIKNPEVVKRVEELREVTEGKNIDPAQQARILQDNLRRLQQDAVLVYPLVLQERLELVLVTSYSPPIRRTVTVSEAELNKTVENFRRDLQSPGSDATRNANKLYQWLIKPLENDLAQAKTKTIIFAPDGRLRYIPLAALHDGKQWLIERFAVNNITALSLIDLNTQPKAEQQVLAAAFTDINRNVTVPLGDKKGTFSGLKYAEQEVDSITNIVSGSTKLVDNQFNQDIIYQMNDYSIVHLATHAVFVDGQPEDSVILLGNGQYVTLQDVKSWNLSNVDLVVLSACETGLGGFGDGKEILGFGYRMQEIGAKAAIATLWQVDDPSTARFMQSFYSKLTTKTEIPLTKAEALRQAQLYMLRGNAQQDIQLEPRGISVEIESDTKPKLSGNYLHPYYWAPFTLIGNGL
ncbi:MAG: tetratricopeptide repeat protein [Calothrix sp. C42_A2020_038]|nr:tetratricopeptide repeat protein [Calothrix sp. C42_A2020_038]